MRRLRAPPPPAHQGEWRSSTSRRQARGPGLGSASRSHGRKRARRAGRSQPNRPAGRVLAVVQVAFDAPKISHRTSISKITPFGMCATVDALLLPPHLSISAHCRPSRKCGRASPRPTDRTILECRPR
jgi:hypothetical protein